MICITTPLELKSLLNSDYSLKLHIRSGHNIPCVVEVIQSSVCVLSRGRVCGNGKMIPFPLFFVQSGIHICYKVVKTLCYTYFLQICQESVNLNKNQQKGRKDEEKNQQESTRINKKQIESTRINKNQQESTVINSNTQESTRINKSQQESIRVNKNQ